MPTLTTADIFPTLTEPNAGPAWTNPGNVVADDGVLASISWGASAGNATYRSYGFAILASDGGPVPDGSTIVNLVLTAELRASASGLGGHVDTAARFGKDRLGTPTTENTHLAAVGRNGGSDSGLQVVTASLGGTEASPQTFYASATDLADDAFWVQVESNRVAGGSSATSSADYVKVTVEYIPPAGKLLPQVV